METITSRTNPLCTHLRKLASSVSYRRDCGEFLCDSPKSRVKKSPKLFAMIRLLKMSLPWSARTPPPCLPCPILSAASRYPGI